MKKIFYKGFPYEALPVELAGRKKFALYHQDQFVHFIDAEDLDKRSAVSLILEDYYSKVSDGPKPSLLQD